MGTVVVRFQQLLQSFFSKVSTPNAESLFSILGSFEAKLPEKLRHAEIRELRKRLLLLWMRPGSHS